MKKSKSSKPKSQKPKKRPQHRKLDPNKRRVLVHERLQQGKKQREIARELGCDEGTVRRDIEILQLSEASLKRIEDGASAEAFLRDARVAAAKKEHKVRVQEEQATGQHSGEVAHAVLDWLKEMPLVQADEEMIIGNVEYQLWKAGTGDIPAAPRRDPAKTLASFTPATLPDEMTDLIPFLINILTTVFLLLAPEGRIRVNAIIKVREAIKDPRRHPAPRWPAYREYHIPLRPY